MLTVMEPFHAGWFDVVGRMRTAALVAAAFLAALFAISRPALAAGARSTCVEAPTGKYLICSGTSGSPDFRLGTSACPEKYHFVVSFCFGCLNDFRVICAPDGK
jgi:hypothetical protein